MRKRKLSRMRLKRNFNGDIYTAGVSEKKHGTIIAKGVNCLSVIRSVIQWITKKERTDFMEKEKLIKTIYDFIKRNGGVSFVEIEELFEKNGFDYKGGKMLALPENPKMVVWCHWTEEACGIIFELLNRGMVMKPASPLIYYIDGKVFPLNIPIAKEINENSNELCWLPVVMNIM